LGDMVRMTGDDDTGEAGQAVMMRPDAISQFSALLE
jgi:hypothetical protein